MVVLRWVLRAIRITVKWYEVLWTLCRLSNSAGGCKKTQLTADQVARFFWLWTSLKLCSTLDKKNSVPAVLAGWPQNIHYSPACLQGIQKKTLARPHPCGPEAVWWSERPASRFCLHCKISTKWTRRRWRRRQITFIVVWSPKAVTEFMRKKNGKRKQLMFHPPRSEAIGVQPDKHRHLLWGVAYFLGTGEKWSRARMGFFKCNNATLSRICGVVPIINVLFCISCSPVLYVIENLYCIAFVACNDLCIIFFIGNK